MTDIFQYKPLALDGCYEIQQRVMEDERGMFVKVFHTEIYNKIGVDFNFAESYYSFSKKNVIRGLHFQLPPHEHYKMIYCLQGKIQDAMVDLRRNSTTSGKNASVILDDQQRNMALMPPGIAHGFLALEESIIVCVTSTVYAPEHDSGVHSQKCGIQWQIDNPILSDKDKTLPTIQGFLQDKLFNSPANN